MTIFPKIYWANFWIGSCCEHVILNKNHFNSNKVKRSKTVLAICLFGEKRRKKKAKRTNANANQDELNSIVIFALLKSHTLWLLPGNRSDWGLTEFDLSAYARTKPSARIISSHTGFRFRWLFLEHSRSKHNNRILRHRVVPNYMRRKYTHSIATIPITNRLYRIEMENLHTQIHSMSLTVHRLETNISTHYTDTKIYIYICAIIQKWDKNYSSANSKWKQCQKWKRKCMKEGIHRCKSTQS